MKTIARLILLLNLTSCTFKNETSRNITSDFYTLDKNFVDVQINSIPEGAKVIVVPFQNSEGQLLIADGEGGFILGTAKVVQFKYPLLSLEQQSQTEHEILKKYMSADIVLTGEFLETEEGFIITPVAISARTGFQMAATKIVVPATQIKHVVLPDNIVVTKAIILDSQIPILSMNSSLKLYAMSSIPLVFFATGPQGGWGGVFRRAFGGGDTRTQTRPVRLSSFPRPGVDVDNLDDDGDDPRDTPPPNFYGEEIDGEQICRTKLQCHNAMQFVRAWGPNLPGLTVLADVRHCGWYTFIPDADPSRIGFHIQSGDSLSKGRLQALVFFSDRGFQELSITYRFTPYDSQPTDNSRSCEIARCIRRNSWAYGARGDRDYQALDQLRPNSNSYIGAMARRCSITSNEFPVANSDGKYPGWNYWRNTGPNVRRPDWLRVQRYSTGPSDRPRFTPYR